MTALGGELTVESEPGRGSVFRVRLPVAPVCAPQSPPLPPARAGALRRCRLLIVDDEPRFAQTLQILLAMDHDVEVIQDAREALVRLRDGVSYDAILCDLMMAEMSGMQLHEELSRVAPEQARRIIFMTGGAFAQSARDFLARVPNPRLLKPFDPRELEELLAALFL